MELEIYPTVDRPPEIVPGRPQRAWMDKFADRHPYRCLPLSMANTSGWELLNPVAFTAEWNGGLFQDDIKLTPDRPHPDFHLHVKSHFSHGVLTFHAGYLFRTPPGWSMIAQGPPNHVKDGIQPLAGLVETDWLPFPFTMNWMFTRPGKVRFEKGEPFCFITLVQDQALNQFQPVIRSLDRNPELKDQYEVWQKHREAFNKRIFSEDPEATREAWQRYYFRGEFPEEIAPKPQNHVNKRRLKAPQFRG
ncbi:MAG: DUF6065 family protein [Phenylobacterium sp.]|jgi:hypothetical protein|uniref:DUF6065 family protein n=1 Tax=Phenylobacterium sp. TaxID=1871053 RepID=UPI002A36486A|nr:DUF6065 family protein [Phenylobacterium sp.]MDX9999644.1 DUF6065 family protein [Phenylobacterium sp.]